MSSPFLGEIRLFAGNFAPSGWATCDGQLLPISQYDALFNLIGTTYGGDGQNTFQLPDLRSRVPIHQGSDQGFQFVMGQNGGTETVTLTQVQMPSHNHPAMGNGSGDQVSPANAYWSADPGGNTAAYVTSNTPPDGTMAADAILPTGGNLPHTNIQPYVCLNYIISLFGIFPTPN
jgi:microcystin-dependent protein